MGHPATCATGRLGGQPLGHEKFFGGALDVPGVGDGREALVVGTEKLALLAAAIVALMLAGALLHGFVSVGLADFFQFDVLGMALERGFGLGGEVAGGER